MSGISKTTIRARIVLLEGQLEQLRVAVAQHEAALAELYRLLELRPQSLIENKSESAE